MPYLTRKVERIQRYRPYGDMSQHGRNFFFDGIIVWTYSTYTEAVVLYAQ
jgi:hypothetical protein